MHWSCAGVASSALVRHTTKHKSEDCIPPTAHGPPPTQAHVKRLLPVFDELHVGVRESLSHVRQSQSVRHGHLCMQVIQSDLSEKVNQA